MNGLWSNWAAAPDIFALLSLSYCDGHISNFVFDFDEKINSVASKQWPLQKEFMAGDINYTHIIVKSIINK